jgi:hypothetical protein
VILKQKLEFSRFPSQTGIKLVDSLVQKTYVGGMNDGGKKCQS